MLLGYDMGALDRINWFRTLPDAPTGTQMRLQFPPALLLSADGAKLQTKPWKPTAFQLSHPILSRELARTKLGKGHEPSAHGFS